MSSLSQFFMGTPARYDQRSRLGPNQQPIQGQLSQAAMGPGAGGAFGDVADYYRGLLSNDSADVNAFAAPEIRRFQQQTVPGLASQFAGIGAGGALHGSGFQNSVLNASTDLGERIAAIRAGLRQNAAQGLQGIGQQSLADYFQNTYQQRSPGFLENLAQAVGKILGSYVGAGEGGGDLFSSIYKSYGQNNLQDQISSGVASGPYGNGATYNPYTGVQE